MKKIILFLMLLGATSFAQTAPATAAKVLTRAEFDLLLKNPEKLLVIDVRRPDEVSTIGGFPVYLSIQISDLEKSLAWIPRDRTIVTVSNHNSRSAQAANLLASKGFKVAGTIGAQNYESDGGKLLKVEPKKPAADASPGKK